ncbi:hypothetical protein MKW92_030044, partial [Papaver armeniacum]
GCAEVDDRGVAHIVEHLAFKSVGAEFGACQIGELLVPIDKPELLSQAISVLAEFCFEVRVSAEDLEKERDAVLEEYRGTHNANGRMQDAHWNLMMEGL